ncbi:MAG: Crp/Fnr family transcriptional regulator [Prevotella sp.]|nr:Crp/Fnr family transcriptional regulator [Prevotella sp.]
MDKSILKALQLCPLFEGMTAEEIDNAMSEVAYRLVRYERKDIYVLAGTPCRYADIIVAGEVTARMVGSSGKFVQMAARSVGAMMAPAFIFSKDNTMPVSIETNRPTTILRMTPASLKLLIEGNQRICMNFIRQLSGVGSFLANKVRMLTLQSVREKVASFLLAEAKRNGSDTFILTKSRQEIADSFAIQKYSLQRCLNEFASQNAIQLDGKSITLIDKQKMISIASK